MKCSNCSNEAKHFLSKTVNGKNSVLFLCDDCLLTGGFIKFEHAVKPAKTADNIFCPHCGTRLNEFLQSGYLGCPACYTAFAKEIGNILPQMHAGVQHKGKKLTRGQSAQPPKELTKEQKIESLKAEMDRAAKEQRFIDAQKLYQEIIRLGGKV